MKCDKCNGLGRIAVEVKSPVRVTGYFEVRPCPKCQKKEKK